MPLPDIRGRASVVKRIVWRGGKALVALLVGEVATLLLLIRDNVLPVDWQRFLRLSSLPSLSVWQWATVTITLITLFILEGAYQEVKSSSAVLNMPTEHGGVAKDLFRQMRAVAQRLPAGGAAKIEGTYTSGDVTASLVITQNQSPAGAENETANSEEVPQE